MGENEKQRESTRQRFDEVAASYDTRFVRMIDRYEEMQAIMIALIDHVAPAPRRVLDLGTGTGEMALRILDRDAAVRVHGVDFSAGMLSQAAAKLARFGGRFTTEAADLARWVPAGDPPDLIVSVLAIHHLADADKAALTRRAAAALRPGGAFINGDLVKGETAAEQAAVEALHLGTMRQRGVPEEEIRERMDRHRKHDIPARVSDQVRWLIEAGFSEVWTPWRHLNQAVILGIR